MSGAFDAAALLTGDGHVTQGVGRLEFQEWSRLLWAIGEADSLVSWLYSAGNTAPAVDPDVRVHTTTSPSINLPATWLAADEIQSHWDKVNEFRTLEQCANDAHGAFCAIEFGRAVSTADRRWPREEHPHAMQAMRCGGCEELTLIYRPPRFPGDRISIDCPKCGHSLDEDGFSAAALIIEAERAGAERC